MAAGGYSDAAKQTWTSGLYMVAKVKQPQGSKAAIVLASYSSWLVASIPICCSKKNRQLKGKNVTVQLQNSRNCI